MTVYNWVICGERAEVCEWRPLCRQAVCGTRISSQNLVTSAWTTGEAGGALVIIAVFLKAFSRCFSV